MNLLELAVKITADTSELNRGLSKAKTEVNTFGSTLKAILTSQVITKGFSLALDGTKKVVSGIKSITQSAVSNYADYEQLVGGVETLFDKSAGTVMKYAKNAYKTAGLSANEYMETATSFSAALLQGLGGDTKKAAKITDMAISDMSDNMNKMGSSMESIQNAYMGFSKQNYTMLDNLKLGYGGTKSEMERLLADATKLSGVKYDISNLADVYNAIHVIQEEMGVTGTTALEAEHTISGSLSAMKSAWQNLITGLGDGEADINELIDNVITSAETAFGNILPVAGRALSGVGKLITELAPIISEKLPELVDEVLPPIINAISTLIQAIIPELPKIFNIIVRELPQILKTIWDAGMEILQEYVPGLAGFINSIVESLQEHLPEIEGFFLSIAEAIQEHLPEIEEVLNTLGNIIIDVFDWILDHGDLIVSILAGILAGFLSFKTASSIIDIVTKLKTATGGLFGLIAANPVAAIIIAIISVVTALVTLWNTNEGFRNAVKGIWDAIVGFFTSAAEKIKEIWSAITDFISKVWETIKNVVQVGIMIIASILNAAFQILTLPWRFIWENFGDEIRQAWDTIKTVVSTVLGVIKRLIESVWNGIRNFLSPILNGIQSSFSNTWNSIKTFVSSAVNGIKTVITTVFTAVKTFVTTVFNAIKSAIETPLNAVKTAVATILDGIKGKFENVFNGVKSFMSGIVSWLKGIFNFQWSLPKIKLPHFSIDGSFSLNPPSVPKLSVDWYKKAMDNAMVLTGPTIFGAMGGKLLGAGEAGTEVVSGAETLMEMIKEAIREVGDDNGFTQIINNYSPTALDASEIARQTRNASRELALRMRIA